MGIIRDYQQARYPEREHETDAARYARQARNALIVIAVIAAAALLLIPAW